MGCNNGEGRQMDRGTELCMVGHRSQRSVIWKRQLNKRGDMRLSRYFCKQRSWDATLASFTHKKWSYIVFCFAECEQEQRPEGGNILFGPFVRSLSIIIRHDRCMLLRRYSIESSLAQLRLYPHHLRLDRDLWQLYDHQSWHGSFGPPLLGIERGERLRFTRLLPGTVPPAPRCASLSPRQDTFPNWSSWCPCEPESGAQDGKPRSPRYRRASYTQTCHTL